MASKTQQHLQYAACLTVAALFAMHAWAAFGAGLDGATGNICKVDLEKRSFELLKETEYAPKTDVGQSRFTIHWTDQTTITNIEEKESFAGIRGPVIADFHGIDDANAKALAEGKPFEARVAILLPGEKTAAGEDQNRRQIVAWFTPEPGEGSRSGTLEVRGQAVKVSLRKRNARIYVQQSLRPADLAKSFWKTTLHGAEADGRFVVKSMEVSPLVDPRTVDDPKLPRVLVIGDSVSMNYEEAAKAALKGVANFHRIEGNSFSTVQGVRNMELWLGDYREWGLQWDVIQFNHGLHDLKQAYDKASERFGDYAVPLEEYKKNLEKEIALLKQTGAKLIWCATTPVPNDNKGPYARRKGAEREFNQAALEVMRRHPDILVNDLCQVVDSSPAFDNWRKGIDVHFYTAEERKLLGDAVAQAVRQALRLPRPGKPAGTAAAGKPPRVKGPEHPEPSAVPRNPSPGHTTYYVDPANGSDTNSGLGRQLAWRSFGHLSQLRLAPGDRVEIVAPGSFDQTLQLTGSGTLEAPVEVRFAPGRYDFYSDHACREAYQISNTNDEPEERKAVGILLAGAKHFRLSGLGACLFYRGKMLEVCIDHSEDITICGLQFDYQRPTVSEFQVVALGPGYADLRIHKDSLYTLKEGSLTWQGEGWSHTSGLAQELDPATNELWRRGDPLNGLKLEELKPFLVRAHGSSNLKLNHIFQLRDTRRDCAGIFTQDSKNITWRDVKFRFLHGMGIVNQFSENLTFDGVSIAPDTASGRTTAAWADCLQVSGCRGKLLVKGCVFSGAHDDAINIHGTYLRVVERLPGHQVKVRFMHPQTFGFLAFRPGDEVEFVHEDSLANYGTNRVQQARLLEPKELLLTLEQPLPEEFRQNDVLENLTWTPEVEIRGCTVSRIPTSGFLISTPRPVLVESNEFRATRMSAILMGADAQAWFESGGVRDMVIRRNRFVRCGEPVIGLQPNNRVANEAVHRNIRIESNEFDLRRTTCVQAKSSRGLRIAGNLFATERPLAPTEPFQTEDCADVRIENNLQCPLNPQGARSADAAPQKPPGPEPINWPAFMRQHDMSFDKLPSGWNEAPHFGNAMVGSMLYQEGNALKLQVFRADVHDHRDDTWGWTAYSRPRLQIGHFLLHPVGKLTGCKWHLDLWNAELTGTITTDRGEIRLRHFTHAVDMGIVTELSPTAGEKDCSWTWHAAEARTTRGGYPTKESQIAGFAKQYGAHYEGALKVFKPNPAGRLENSGETSVWIQDLLGGGQYATAWAEQVHGESRTHLVSIADSYPSTNAAAVARADVERFLKLDRTGWVQLHRDWWHAYYPRSFVSLPDKGLESLYWQTIYRYGCTTRAGRCFVDTPGLWFQGKSWPYFTTDWNIQSAHWAVYAANRLEQGQALVDRLYEQREELIKAVRPLAWQNDSAYLPLAVAWDMRGSREGDMRYYELVGTLTWALNNGWSQYRYSMDEAMLREKIYPLLRRAINLYLHMVQEKEDGKMHLPPTYSPETSVCEDCNFDLALLKWGCLTLLKSSQRLSIADPLIPRWREVAERLPDFAADEHGFRLGRDKSSPANHQHFSHLLMIYPLHLVNIEQAGTAEVLRRSFERARGNTGPGQRQAMVQAHVGPIAAALGLGDEALESLKHLQGDLYPNGLWYESPCIESSLAAANIIQDMLLQSWSEPAKAEPGPIRIFPALPSSWKDVEFDDLRAEGAFLVSAKRSGGKTAWVRIRSLAGEPCRVRPGMTGEIRLKGERQFRLETVAPGIYQVDLNKGEEVLLSAGSDDSSQVAAPGSR